MCYEDQFQTFLFKSSASKVTFLIRELAILIHRIYLNPPVTKSSHDFRNVLCAEIKNTICADVGELLFSVWLISWRSLFCGS